MVESQKSNSRTNTKSLTAGLYPILSLQTRIGLLTLDENTNKDVECQKLGCKDSELRGTS